jgi:hypothetical protein
MPVSELAEIMRPKQIMTARSQSALTAGMGISLARRGRRSKIERSQTVSSLPYSHYPASGSPGPFLSSGAD